MPDEDNDIVILSARCSACSPDWPCQRRKCGDCGEPVWAGEEIIEKERDPNFKKFQCTVCFVDHPPDLTKHRVHPVTRTQWFHATRHMTPGEKAVARLKVLFLTGQLPPEDA